MEYDKDYVEECANVILKSESIMQDDDLMAQVKPVIEEMRLSAERLKGFDYKSMRELAAKKALEEQEAEEKTQDAYYSGDATDVVLGEKLVDNKIPGKA